MFQSINLQPSLCTQSSLYDNKYPAGNAVTQDLSKMNHTKDDFQPWWQVDFGSAFVVSKIIITNRQKVCQDRLKNFSVLLSLAQFGQGTLDKLRATAAWSINQGKQQEVYSFDVPQVLAKYLRVQLRDKNWLHMARVEVFGLPHNPPPTNPQFYPPGPNPIPGGYPPSNAPSIGGNPSYPGGYPPSNAPSIGGNPSYPGGYPPSNAPSTGGTGGYPPSTGHQFPSGPYPSTGTGSFPSPYPSTGTGSFPSPYPSTGTGTFPSPYPNPSPSSSVEKCFKCKGKGGMGAFGPCKQGDVHFREVCPVCRGNGTYPGTPKCPKCKGKGGMGAFGACEISPRDTHFRQPCPLCQGSCLLPPHLRGTKCNACKGMGGNGAFGPCELHDVHFRSKCTQCHAGYN